MIKMFVVVSYDIVDDRRRARVLNELKNYGNHVQYSVFECYLEKQQIENLKDQLHRLINEKEDSIRYYFLCGSCIERIVAEGKAYK